MSSIVEIKYLDDGVKHFNIILKPKTEYYHLRMTQPELPEPDKFTNLQIPTSYLSRNALLQ